jgi:hypothetical protein
VRRVHGGDGEICGGKNSSRRGEAERERWWSRFRRAVVVSIQASGVSYSCIVWFRLASLARKKLRRTEEKGHLLGSVFSWAGRVSGVVSIQAWANILLGLQKG